MNEHLFGPLRGGDALREYVASYRRSDLPPLDISAPLDLFPSQPRSTGIVAKSSWADMWPFHDRPGVYMIYSESGELMYIGKASMTRNLGQRLYEYFGGGDSCVIRDQFWPQAPRYVINVAVPANLPFEAPALEEFLIGRLNPTCNVAGKWVIAVLPVTPGEQSQTPAPDEFKCLVPSAEGIYPIATRTWKINTSALVPGNSVPPLVREIGEWAADGGGFIYRFSVVGPTDWKALERSFVEAKKSDESRRGFARLNGVSNGCLYVGNATNLARRIREHLGYGYGEQQTYSLQLAHWARSLDIVLELVCAKYSPETAKGVIEAMEDSLWDRLQPMFGKKGRR